MRAFIESNFWVGVVGNLVAAVIGCFVCRHGRTAVTSGKRQAAQEGSLGISRFS